MGTKPTTLPRWQSDPLATVGLTVADIARRYRIGTDKVRAWIARGELQTINTASALCSRPRWVVTPQALAEFEARHGRAAAKAGAAEAACAGLGGLLPR